MDRLFLKDVEAWNAADLDVLVEARIPEGMRVEYKRDLNLDTKSQKVEAAKDVSGFANAQGGWLFFGIDEDDSDEPLPVAVDPLPAEGLQTRLETSSTRPLNQRLTFTPRPLVSMEGS